MPAASRVEVRKATFIPDTWTVQVSNDTCATLFTIARRPGWVIVEDDAKTSNDLPAQAVPLEADNAGSRGLPNC